MWDNPAMLFFVVFSLMLAAAWVGYGLWWWFRGRHRIRRVSYGGHTSNDCGSASYFVGAMMDE